MKNTKLSVILLNLGGPDKQESVKPFLFNLFNDPFIIRIPQPFRYMLAWLISTLRYKKAQGIYENLGGKSPLLENTVDQANALKTLLEADFKHVGVHISMRYWHPFSHDIIENIKSESPDDIVLLTLYPQLSTTTTTSSLKDMKKVLKKHNVTAKIHQVCCYPKDATFIKSHVHVIQQSLKNVPDTVKPCLVFSAHGVPQDIIDDGDPYEWQVNQTILEIMKHFENMPYKVCYQSKVGPKKWLEPSLDTALEEVAKEKYAAVVIPIAFVSEHSETLVELDMDYRDMAKDIGIPHYERVPALNSEPLYIESLRKLTLDVLEKPMESICPPEFTECACRKMAS